MKHEADGLLFFLSPFSQMQIDFNRELWDLQYAHIKSHCPPTLHIRGKPSKPNYLSYFLWDGLSNLIFGHCKMNLENQGTAATWGPDCPVALVQSSAVVCRLYTRRLLQPILSPWKAAYGAFWHLLEMQRVCLFRCWLLFKWKGMC